MEICDTCDKCDYVIAHPHADNGWSWDYTPMQEVLGIGAFHTTRSFTTYDARLLFAYNLL